MHYFGQFATVLRVFLYLWSKHQFNNIFCQANLLRLVLSFSHVCLHSVHNVQLNQKMLQPTLTSSFFKMNIQQDTPTSFWVFNCCHKSSRSTAEKRKGEEREKQTKGQLVLGWCVCACVYECMNVCATPTSNEQPKEKANAGPWM